MSMTTKEMLAVLMTEVKDMKCDIKEIKDYTGRINGGLRNAQNDVATLKANYQNQCENIGDLKKRMNLLSAVSTSIGIIAAAVAALIGWNR